MPTWDLTRRAGPVFRVHLVSPPYFADGETMPERERCDSSEVIQVVGSRSITQASEYHSA